MNTERMAGFSQESDIRNLEMVGKKDVLRNEKKEALFKAVLVRELRDVLKEAMEENDLDEEAINNFFSELALLSDEEALAVMAVPREIQGRVFGIFKNRFEKGELDETGFLDQLKERVKKSGYRLAFHISNQDIGIKKDEDDGTEKWDIEGTENDHRDGDLRRAYYSFDYQNLYRKKGGKYLYLVRAETGPNTPHRQDNDGSWGRASKLPIVARLDLDEVDQRIENGMKEEKNVEN